MLNTCVICFKDYQKHGKSHKDKCNPCYQKEYYRKDKKRRLQLNQEWRKANPEKRAEQSWREHRKRRYGLSEEAFMAIYHAQGGKCDMCGVSKEAYSIRGLCVDHDHKTGKVRGLLCTGCNTGIGSLKEDIELLLKAVEYLRKHKS